MTTRAKAARELVRPSSLMDQQTFRLHCRARHPRLRFWGRGEHDADHEARSADLDHDHREDGQHHD